MGLICAGLVIVPVGYLMIQEPPDAQRFVMINEYEDAACTMGFTNGTRVKFSVAKGDTYRKTFKSPKDGFVTVRCNTDSGPIESPNSFHLRRAAAAILTFDPNGRPEASFDFDPGK
jgi:hypothetical protein